MTIDIVFNLDKLMNFKFIFFQNKMLESRQLFSFKNGLKFVKPDSLTETVISGLTLLQRACSEGLPGTYQKGLRS